MARCLAWGALLCTARAQNAGVAGHGHSDTTGLVCNNGDLVSAATGALADTGKYVATRVITAATNINGGNVVYRVELALGPQALSVYSIFGNAQPLRFPPAVQVPDPFGADIGGVSPAMLSLPSAPPNLQWDSWLTIGASDGSMSGSLSATGLNFDTWDHTTPLQSASDAGAVFFLDADDGTECFSPKVPTALNPVRMPGCCQHARLWLLIFF